MYKDTIRKKLNKEHQELASEVTSMARQVLEQVEVRSVAVSGNQSSVLRWRRIVNQAQDLASQLTNNEYAILPPNDESTFLDMRYKLMKRLMQYKPNAA